MQVVAGEDLSPAIVTVGDVVAASVERRKKRAGGAEAAGAGGPAGAQGLAVSGEYPDR